MLKEMTVLKFQGQIVSFIPIFDMNGQIPPICKIECVDKKLKFGNVGTSLYLDRKMHDTFQGVTQRVTISGTVKLEYENGILVNAVFYIDNSQLFLLLNKNANVPNNSQGRKILLG